MRDFVTMVRRWLGPRFEAPSVDASTVRAVQQEHDKVQAQLKTNADRLGRLLISTEQYHERLTGKRARAR